MAHYAALIAAAYTRTVIEYLHPIMQPPSGAIAQVPGFDASTGLPRGCPLAATHCSGEPPSNASAVLEGTAPETSHKAVGTPTGVDLGQPEATESAEMAERLMSPVDAVLSNTIGDITAKIQILTNEYRWPAIEPLAAELERQLQQLSRRGSQVRKAWMVLAQAEARRLRQEKLAGYPVDVSRLQAYVGRQKMSLTDRSDEQRSQLAAIAASEAELTDGPTAALAILGPPADPVRMRATLGILVRAKRHQDAADLIRNQPPNEKWIELGALVLAFLGDIEGESWWIVRMSIQTCRSCVEHDWVSQRE